MEVAIAPKVQRIAPSADICAISINMHLLIVLESGFHRSELCEDLPTKKKKKKLCKILIMFSIQIAHYGLFHFGKKEWNSC